MYSFPSPQKRNVSENINNPYIFNLNPFSQGNETKFRNGNYHNDTKKIQNFQDNHSFQDFNSKNSSLVVQENSPKRVQVSFARNFKGRLFNYDPQGEREKEETYKRYRQELKIQMEEQIARKKREEQRIKELDMKEEREFYQKIKIQAQKKESQPKDEPNYFMLRSSRAIRKKQGNQAKSRVLEQEKFGNKLIGKTQSAQVNVQNKLFGSSPPQIKKRDGYHNKSSLDRQQFDVKNHENSEKSMMRQASSMPTAQIKKNYHNMEPLSISQKNYEEQRIANLLLFQSNMLKKLDIFRKEIVNTNHHLDLRAELEKVKITLRAKQLNMAKIKNINPKIGIDDIFQNQSQFYNLPLVHQRPKINRNEGQRLKNRKHQQRRNRNVSLDHIKNPQNEQQTNELSPIPLQLKDNTGRKYLQNDKNINIKSDFDESEDVDLPIVNQNPESF